MAARRRKLKTTKFPAPAGPPRRIRALEIEDIVENIVDHAFSDRQDENGVYNDEALPKRFIGFALVNRSFVNPIRRCLYGDLTLEGPERFLLLTGQLRFSPHLAKFVKRASLRSACQARELDDTLPHYMQAPDQDQPRPMSTLALKWFLDACPQLTRLSLFGGDFISALARQKAEDVRLTHVNLSGCFRCRQGGCWDALNGGWLRSILAFPRLVEIDVDHIDFGGGDDDPIIGGHLPNARTPSSVATELSLGVLQREVVARSLIAILRLMPRVKELVLDGLTTMTSAELKKCIDIAAPTLTLLSINGYANLRPTPMHLNDAFFANCRRLEQLALNDVSILPSVLNALPRALRLLRLSKAAVQSLSADFIIKWLKANPFPLPGLKELFIFGDLQVPSTAEQTEEIKRLCKQKNIDLTFRKEWFSFDDFDAGELTQNWEGGESDDEVGLNVHPDFRF
ncbi:hypothetical protein MIND_01099400 [Mycena indigotica]|uniref:Uncharacterized protein n=1 Tax=Mycena indigotica TaxID=2126181 RepID=A0A8H6VZ42_9AGAR|nr:uncharacterized protein MIND_01099400 [Mycena indigotica]KAF7295593.1 hypothetical protein MIND_01099400 [Mycena indigotica]